MFKKIITPVVILAAITISIVSWQQYTYSQVVLPYPEGKTCEDAYGNAMGILEGEWMKNLRDLTDQEKPASDMMDEAFESMRTYNCWMEYVCRAVFYSTNPAVKAADTKDTGLKKIHIGQVPGCQAPEDVGLPSGWKNAWDTVVNTLVNNPTDQIGVKNKFTIIPQCQTKGTPNEIITASNNNYNACMEELEKKFACTAEDETVTDCKKRSIAIIKLEAILKKTNAAQKSRALENKLAGMIKKMRLMESHAGYMKEKFTALDRLYPCTAPTCD